MTAIYGPTSELPAVRAVTGAVREPGYVTFEDDVIDERLAELAEPVETGPGLVSRLVAAGQELASTPLRAAVCSASGFAAAVLVWACADRPTVSVHTALGPARAACGLDVYLYGDPDKVVAGACVRADSAHLGLAIASAAVLLAGAVGAAFIVARRHDDTDASRRYSPIRWLQTSLLHASVAAMGLMAVVVGALAVRPVPIEVISGDTAIDAHCGADTYFFGYPDQSISSQCQRAYAGHAHVLIGAAVVLGVAVIALGYLIFTELDRRLQKVRLTAGAIAVALVVLSILALMPKSVSVDEGGRPVVAACGVDSYLVGNPDYAVQSSCRSHYGVDAAIGLSSAALAMLAVAVAVVVPVRRRRSPTSQVHGL